MKTNTPEDAELILQKLPSDMGIHRNPRKGTLNAPESILEELEFSRTVLVEDVFPNEFDLEETQRRIRENTESLLNYEKPILSIGGDHSVSYPAIRALKEKYPDLRVVWLDSHLDLKKKVEGHVSHDVVVRELLQNGFSEDEIVFVGITRIDDDEEGFLEEHDLDIYTHDEIEEFLKDFDSEEAPVYLSVDIDVLREDLAPGTGYPDGKLCIEEVKQAIDTAEPAGADLVEVAPPLDRESRTLRSAREVLSALVEELGPSSPASR